MYKLINFIIIIIFSLILLSCNDNTVIDAPVCGNNKLESFEDCDDGNLIDGDGCSSFCHIEMVEDCINNMDDDGDSLIDCSDPDCFGEDNCNGEICQNGVDDDNNGLIDCEDPVCSDFDYCKFSEICDNSKDDDKNGFTDCEDPVCLNSPVCGACDEDKFSDNISPGTISDIDLNSFIHTEEGACFTGNKDFAIFRFRVVSAVSFEMISSVISSEATSFTAILYHEEEPGITCELDFKGCYNLTLDSTSLLYQPLLPPGTYRLYISGHGSDNVISIDFGDPVLENCNNNIDDDNNGLVDCEDPQCSQYPSCLTEDCSNGVDDDLDSMIDCSDPDCAIFCAPPEDCSNGIDDDLDGSVDCKDFDCTGNSLCAGSSCISYSYLGELNRGSYIVSDFDTTISDNSYHTSCGGMGPDYTFSFDLLSYSNLFINMTQTGSHSLALATEAGPLTICPDGELSCNESPGLHLPLSVTFHDLAPAKYFILIDTESNDASGYGTIEMNVSGVDDELCANQIDDDNDGMVDCDDSDCGNLSICHGETLCHDFSDNDNDGWSDCQDPDCVGSSECIEGYCTVDRDIGTLSLASPLSVMVNLVSGTNQVTLPCGSQEPRDGTVFAFYLAEAGNVRVRTIPQGFEEPITAIAFPSGVQSQCDDGVFICSSVPAPGLAGTFITPVELPAGGPYYLIVTPYDAQSSGTAQIILYLN